MNAPCLDCKDRVLKCHSTCERYKEYRQTLYELNEEARRKEKIRKSLDDYKCRKINNYKKRNKKG